MYAPEFEYHKAATVAEAIQLLSSNEDAKLLAGGHSLLPLLKLRLARPSALIDIGGVSELKGITISDGSVRIGALTTHRQLMESHDLEHACSLLGNAAGGIGDAQVRNRGTIGGNIVHADPASDWPAVLTALDAKFNIQGAGGATRTVDPGDFFVGPLTTTLGEQEILTSIDVPTLGHHQRAEYAKMAHPASGFAVVGAAVVVSVHDGKCTTARIAVGGLVPVPVRMVSVEAALIGKELNQENIAEAASHASEDLTGEILGDFFASAEYRKAMAEVEIRHALFHATEVSHH
jgi:carbon-monoxide dehydrogenase medium subunit